MKKMYRTQVEHNDNEVNGWNFETVEQARECYDKQDIIRMFYDELRTRGDTRFMRGEFYAKSIIPVVVDEFGDSWFDEDSDEQFDLPCDEFSYEDYQKLEESEYEAWKESEEE